jgi:hypothetical protein
VSVWVNICSRPAAITVAQISKSAVSQVSKPAKAVAARERRVNRRRADLEIGDTAGLETCATAKPARHVRKFTKV